MSQNFTLGYFLQEKLKIEGDRPIIGHIKNGILNHINLKDYFKELFVTHLILKKCGLSKDTKLALLLPPSQDAHLYDLSCMISRGVSIPLYERLNADSMIEMIKSSDAEIVVLENQEQAKILCSNISLLPFIKTIIVLNHFNLSEIMSIYPSINIGINSHQTLKSTINIDSKISITDELLNLLGKISPTDLATIKFTLGTEGETKGVMIDHQALFFGLFNIQKYFNNIFNSQDTNMTFLSLAHIYGRISSNLHLLFDLTNVFAERYQDFQQNLELVSPSLILGVPRILDKIYNDTLAKINRDGPILKNLFQWAETCSNNYFKKIEDDLSPSTSEMLKRNAAYNLIYQQIRDKLGGKIRFFISSGAPLNNEVMQFFRNSNITVLEAYGLTETVGPVSINPVVKQIPATVGRPMPEVKITLAEDGEILVKSPSMFCGLYKNPTKYNAQFTNGWFHTGDLGRLNSYGHLVLIGRKKNLLTTSNGQQIFPERYQYLANNFAKQIEQIVVIADQRSYVTALITLKSEPNNNDQPNAQIETDIQLINNHLSPFEQIKNFRIVGRTDTKIPVMSKIAEQRFSQIVKEMYH